MSSKEYLKQYRQDNKDKHKIWDKQQRDKHKIRMQTDEEYKELYMRRRRESCRNRRAKIKADPELLVKQKVLDKKYFSKWYEKEKKLKRVLKNMKTVKVDESVKPSEPTSLGTVKQYVPISKQKMYEKIALKICSLERLITIDSIREPKIKQLKEEYYEEYGIEYDSEV